MVNNRDTNTIMAAKDGKTGCRLRSILTNQPRGSSSHPTKAASLVVSLDVHVQGFWLTAIYYICAFFYVLLICPSFVAWTRIPEGWFRVLISCPHNQHLGTPATMKGLTELPLFPVLMMNTHHPRPQRTANLPSMNRHDLTIFRTVIDDHKYVLVITHGCNMIIGQHQSITIANPMIVLSTVVMMFII